MRIRSGKQSPCRHRKHYENYTDCGNQARSARAIYCQPCIEARRNRQKCEKNERAYRALREPGSVVLADPPGRVAPRRPDRAEHAWEAFAKLPDGADDRPAANHLLDTVEYLLAEGWDELPSSLTHGQPDPPGPPDD